MKSDYNNQIELLAIEAFKTNGFLVVNKTLIKRLGLLPATVLSNYIEKYAYFKEHYAECNGWFFLTHAKQIEQLNVSEATIIRCKNYLKEQNILLTERRGLPAKEWYSINFKELVTLLDVESSHTPTVPLSPRGQVPQESEGHNIRYKENIYYIKNTPERNSIPPTLEQVTAYCKSRHNAVDPEKFIDYNTSKGWVVGKTRMKDWQAAVRTWEKNDQGTTNKFKPKYVTSDGIRYYLRPDGEYYHPKSGDRYIP
jgi:hypothetical protein